MAYDTDLMRKVSGKVAVVGIGDTDYGKDYRQANGATRRRGEPGERDSYGLAALAFSRALADSGLKKSDIDGVVVSGPISSEVTCEYLGLTPNWGSTLSGLSDAIIPLAVMAIMSGHCTTVALIKGDDQRSRRTEWGGPRSQIGRLGEVYFHPWGFSSPGAQHALMWQRYMDIYGKKEEDLFVVPSNARKWANMNPNAVMHGRELTFDSWWASEYIAKPLRLLDYTMINDGGTCMILRRADLSTDLPHNDVVVSGFSWETVSHSSQLGDRVGDHSYAKIKAAADACYAMGEVGPEDIDHFQVYDAFSDILIWSLEGMGFCGKGEAIDFMGPNGENIFLGGELPSMTSGGHQSDCYLQGWSQQTEAVRQLRHACGERQVQGAENSLYVHPGGEGPHTVMYRRVT